MTDAYDSLGRVIEETQQIGDATGPGHRLGLAGRRPPQQPDLSRWPRRGLHLRRIEPAQDRLRPGGRATDRRVRVHRPRPRARAKLPDQRHKRDVPRQLGDRRRRLRRHGPADRGARPRGRRLPDRRFHLHLRPDGQQADRREAARPGQQRDLHLRLRRPPHRLPARRRRPRAAAGLLDARRRRQLDLGRFADAAILVQQRSDRAAERRFDHESQVRQQRQRDRRRYVRLQLRRVQPAPDGHAQVRRGASRHLLVRRRQPPHEQGRDRTPAHSTAPPTSITTGGRTSRTATATAPSSSSTSSAP